jgi:putative SOS response-associated peptidase YedK
MCGRYVLKTLPQKIMEAIGVIVGPLPELFPRYNIAPTQQVPVVRLDKEGARRLSLVKWGLVPSWAKDPSIGNRQINARAETVSERPAFRDAFARRRCLVPADGFYEWHTTGAGKQPIFIHRADDRPFCFAGLWERWHDPDSDADMDSMTIITTTPNRLMAPIHNRMPVILGQGAYDPWLNRDTPPQRLGELLVPAPDDGWLAQAVSTHVNNPRNDDAECVRPIDG